MSEFFLFSQQNSPTKFKSSNHFFQWGVNIVHSFASPEFIKLFHSGSSHVKITVQIPGDDVKICIKTEGNFNGSLFILCDITLLDVEGKERDSKRASHHFEKAKTWEFPTFIKKSQLNSEKDQYIKDNRFKLNFDIIVLDGCILRDIKEKRDLPLFTNLASGEDTFAALTEDIKRMYEDKIHTDIKLKAGTEVFPIHKNILCARSPVFFAMFNQDMAESQKGEVDIPDLDAKTVEYFLEFIYTGRVRDLDCEDVLKLILAADKYQVPLLKNKCAELLETMLSDAHVSQILVTADLIQHTTLKASVFDYIKKQPKKIFNSEEWKHCVKNNFELAIETLSEVSRLWGNQAEEQLGNGFYFKPSSTSDASFKFGSQLITKEGFASALSNSNASERSSNPSTYIPTSIEPECPGLQLWREKNVKF